MLHQTAEHSVQQGVGSSGALLEFESGGQLMAVTSRPRAAEDVGHRDIKAAQNS